MIALVTNRRASYNPMKTAALAIKLTDEEEACFAAVQEINPMVKRASLGEMLVLLGALKFWQMKAAGEDFRPQDVLAEVQKLQANYAKKHKK